MATEKEKRALLPVQPMADEASYQAFIAGVGQNKEYKYESGKGFVATNDPDAQRNVFSTFALLQDNTVTTQELLKDRIENADDYSQRAQKIASVISNTMPRYFNKSSYVGGLVDLSAFALEGAESTVQRTFAAAYNLPDTWRDIQVNAQLDYLLQSLNEQEKKDIEFAVRKQYVDFLGQGTENRISPDRAYSLLSLANVEEMTSEGDKPLTEREKDVIKKFQEQIVSNEQIKRNQMADVWFDQMLGEQIAGSFVKPNMGSKTLRAVGNAAGNIIASGLMFAAAGAAPEMVGMGAATTAARLGAQQTAKGVSLALKASKAKGIAQKYLATGRATRAYQISSLARNAAKWSNYKMGVGSFVSNNFPQMVALSSIMGRGAVFSQSFLSQFSDIRNSLISKGADSETATSTALAAGLAEASIETFFGFRFLNRFLTEQRSFKNFLFKATIPEGLQELSQTAAENAITKATGFNDATFADIAAEMVFSFIGGALGGAAFAGGSYRALSEYSRMDRVMDYELAKAKTANQMSRLNLLGQRKDSIAKKYAEESKQARISFEQKTKEKHAEIEKEYKNLRGSNPNWRAEAEARYMEWERQEQDKYRAEEADRQKRFRNEIQEANAGQAQRERLADEAEFEQNRYGSLSDETRISSFTTLEQDLLSQMRDEYEDRARTVNPDITLEQLNNGWNGVKALLEHEGYTGEFTTAVSNAIDNMISFSTAADQNIKEGLNNLINQLGLTPEESDAAVRMTSKDKIEAYNAELDVMEESIIRDFRLAGAETEGKAFAKIFRNQLGTLPLFAKDEDGNSMTPLSFYNAVKPRIISIQNAIMHNQEIPNIENTMYEITRQSDSEENYHTGNRWKYKKAYDKYQNIIGLIEAYKQSKEKDKEVLLANINLALFNAYNYTNDVDLISDYINARQEKEYGIVHELGLDAGKNLSNEDYAILALMRQKGLSFAFAAKSIGLVRTDSSNDAVNKRYEEKLNDLYPPLTRSDINWINKISNREDISKLPEYRSYSIDTKDNMRVTYDIESREDANMRKQAEKDILEEEGELLTQEPEINGSKIIISEQNQQAMDKAAETQGISSRFITPNALYAREGKTILVINGKNQGEFLHEAGHYLITEFLLQNMELGAMTGDRALGPVNKLLISLYQAVKGNESVKLNQVQRQETILDALMDFIRTDGKTGNPEADAILRDLQSILNDDILHPDNSKYERLPDAQKNLLRENIRNLFKPSTSIDMLNAKVDLENKINNSNIDEACSAGVAYLEKYAIPNMDIVRYKLENKSADYIEKRTALEELKNEINLQAISLMLDNDENLQAKHEKIGLSSRESEDIADNAILMFAEQEKAQNSVSIARHQLSAKERGIKDAKDLPKNLKRFSKAISTGSKALFSSLVDLGNKIDPAIGSIIQKQMFDEAKMRAEGQSYGKRFMDAFSKKQAGPTPISQEEYDINFVDNLNNYKINKARAWLLRQIQDPDLRNELQESFDGMIDWMESAKETMQALDVHPESGWMLKTEFFPRSIKDYEEFSDFINQAPKNILDQVARTAGSEEANTAKAQRKAEYEAQRLFAQIARNGEHANRVKFLNERVIREVKPEYREFYKDPIDAYMDYVEDVCLTVTTRRLIGADKQIAFWDEETGQLKDIESAALIYKALQEKGQIYTGRLDMSGLDDAAKEEVKKSVEDLNSFMKALSAFINRHKEVNPMMRFTNDILTATMLGHLSTAVSQGYEMITTSLDFGLKNTIGAAIDVIKGKSKITIKDLNIDELEDQYKPLCQGTIAAVTNGILKYTGFKMFDVYFKNVAINSIYNYFDSALKKEGSEEYNEAIELIDKSFAGDPNFQNRKQKLLEDISNKQISDDIKFLMYNIFARQQPINAANISYGYNAVNSVGRLCLFKFNTVAYKQTARIVNKLKSSFVDKDGNVDLLKGSAAVLRFMLYCALIGIPLDTIKNILNGKMEFNPKKSFIFSVGQAFLINEYEAHMAQSQGIGSMIAGKFAPPFTVANAGWKDLTSVLPGGKEFRAQSLKWVPGLRPVHNWIYSVTTAPNDSEGYDFDILNLLEDENDSLWG